MNITTVVDAQAEPATLAEVYRQLRLVAEGSPVAHADDALLTALLTAARHQVEELSRRTLIYKSLRLSSDSWPATGQPDTEIRLYYPPVIAVSSVSYYDADNVLQAVADTDYYLTDEFIPQVQFVTGYSFPTLYDRPDAVRVVYLAGYPPVGSPPATQEEYSVNVPAPLKQAVLIGVQLLYDELDPRDREALEKAQACLIQPLKVPAPI